METVTVSVQETNDAEVYFIYETETTYQISVSVTVTNVYISKQKLTETTYYNENISPESRKLKAYLTKVMEQKKNNRFQAPDLGSAAVLAVVRVLIVYACVVFVHSLLYWGRRALRARAARRCRS